ncbi:MAG: hypothetical protein JNL52_02890 [Flavobacteriales bacterium]|nr:hypothetical protein [Flavobacteriales bacterium]
MGIRKFHTRRVWHNTQLVIWLAPLLLLAGVISVTLLDTFSYMIAITVLCAVAAVIALVRDVRKRYVYVLDDEGLHIEKDGQAEYVPMIEVVDASLIDRAAAREYIKSRSQGMSKAQARLRYLAYIRFCSVDIGRSSLTGGLGRSLIDRLPEARHDLVLMRLKDGTDLLLSPDYNQEMVTSLSKNARRSSDLAQGK